MQYENNYTIYHQPFGQVILIITDRFTKMTSPASHLPDHGSIRKKHRANGIILSVQIIPYNITDPSLKAINSFILLLTLLYIRTYVGLHPIEEPAFDATYTV